MSETDAMDRTNDCGGDAAAYVLGALEPAEADEFERHLAECVVCRDEVDALTGVVQALPMSAPQRPAPARLRRRVMRAVRQEPKRQGTRGRRLIRSGSWSGSRAAAGALAAAAVTALAVLGGLDLSSSSPSGRVIRARVAGSAGSAELRVSQGRGELVVRHLSPPPPGHVYEVWLKAPGAKPRPASVLFSVTRTGSADVGLPGTLRGISQVMVTPEPDGGTLAPTHSPIIVASLS